MVKLFIGLVAGLLLVAVTGCGGSSPATCTGCDPARQPCTACEKCDCKPCTCCEACPAKK